jgi:2-polyprenyl-3-methyl-5-hydroxy-6-metoxy-1,4-benzoquinol methylase
MPRMNRIERLLSSSNRASRILELGPSVAPVAPKAAGWQTTVVDQLPRDALREKFATLGRDPNAIEDVDFIWSNGALHEAIPAALHGSFDTIIASHVVEHLPDFAGFFTSATALLGATGSIALALPDRRLCFDYFRPLTMTADVLDARGVRRHSHRTVFSAAAYSVAAGNATDWRDYNVDDLRLVLSLDDAAAARAAHRNDDAAPVADYHASVFTPSSFLLLMLELGHLGIVDWHVEGIFDSEGPEFIALLRRGADAAAGSVGLEARRRALLLDTLAELRDQTNRLGPLNGRTAAGHTRPEDSLPTPEASNAGTASISSAEAATEGYRFTAACVAKFFNTVRISGTFHHPVDRLTDATILDVSACGCVAEIGSASHEGSEFCVQVLRREEEFDATAVLRFTTAVGRNIDVRLGELCGDRSATSRTAAIFRSFRALADAVPDARVLDIGGRNRSHIDHSKNFRHAACTVFDIHPGENVDVVGDAHRLASYFKPDFFDAVMSIAVFEHIMMPWAVIPQMNQVLKLGGHAYISAPQTFAVHDAPWDFWRFTDAAWDALFNRFTGFEIIERAMDETQFVIPAVYHSFTRDAERAAGYASSTVLVRKIGSCKMHWELSASDLTSTAYPPGEHDP